MNGIEGGCKVRLGELERRGGMVVLGLGGRGGNRGVFLCEIRGTGAAGRRVVFRRRSGLGIAVGNVLSEMAASWCLSKGAEAADFQKRDGGPEEHAREEQVQAWARVHVGDDSLECASVQRFGRFFGASGSTDCAMKWGKEVDACGLRW